MSSTSKIYDFPPFFTKQPNEETWKKQQTLWQEVIRSHCISTSNYTITSNDALFTNSKIDRKLSPDVCEEIFKEMASQSLGELISPSELYVYKMRPEELANKLISWAAETGHNGTVLTFFELSEGELPGIAEFTGIDTKMMHLVADIMVKKSKATKMKIDGEYLGLKLI